MTEITEERREEIERAQHVAHSLVLISNDTEDGSWILYIGDIEIMRGTERECEIKAAPFIERVTALAKTCMDREVERAIEEACKAMCEHCRIGRKKIDRRHHVNAITGETPLCDCPELHDLLEARKRGGA